jgi:hypothetical protein
MAGLLSDDFAPDGTWEFFNFGFYKYVSPDGLRFRRPLQIMTFGLKPPICSVY